MARLPSGSISDRTMSHSQMGGATEEFREPSDAEARVLMTLLGAEFPGNTALREQVPNAMVRRIDGNGSLEVAVVDGPRAEVVRRIPVEAEADDDDGVPIHVLLHVIDGRMRELEFYREDSQPLHRPPTPANLRVLVL